MADHNSSRTARPVHGNDPAAEPVLELVAASRLRAAVGLGTSLSCEGLEAIHPTFLGLASRPGRLSAIASLCGLAAARRGRDWTFSELADAPTRAGADVPWTPALPSLASAGVLELTAARGGPRGDAEAFVVTSLAAGPLRAKDVKSLAGAAGMGHAAALAAVNGLIARGTVGIAEGRPDRAVSWEGTCGAFLELARRAGRVHAPYAARELRLGSPTDAALVGRYLADRGLVRIERGAYVFVD